MDQIDAIEILETKLKYGIKIVYPYYYYYSK